MGIMPALLRSTSTGRNRRRPLDERSLLRASLHRGKSDGLASGSRDLFETTLSIRSNAALLVQLLLLVLEKLRGAFPIPLLAPVITTTLLLIIDISILFSLLRICFSRLAALH